MINNIKIPAGYSIDQIKLAMDTLVIDPNYICLLAIIEANDMAKMREEIENPATPDSELKEKRYRLAVFKELMHIAGAIRKACEPSANQNADGEGEIYHTEDTLQT